MEIEEIVKENTIEFPRPIGREDAENLLCYIAGELPASVNSKIEYHRSFVGFANRDVVDDMGSLTVIASIGDLNEKGGYDTFVSKPWREDPSHISTIATQIVPDWELSDYRPEVRRLWKDVREIVDKYFREVLKTRTDDKEGLNTRNSKK